MNVDAASKPARGRPRDPRCDAAIADAAIELVAELGYERTSVEAIAQRAGVSKPTIYRRWPGKRELIVDALRERKSETAASWDTGSLRGDLLAAARDITRSLAEETKLAAGLSGAMRESEELAQLIRDHVVADDRRRYMAIVERAVARGELADDRPASKLFADVAPSLVFTRMLVTREPVGRSFIEELVDRILLPILLTPTQ
jgi:AcrR family transcriptional regulator